MDWMNVLHQFFLLTSALLPNKVETAHKTDCRVVAGVTGSEVEVDQLQTRKTNSRKWKYITRRKIRNSLRTWKERMSWTCSVNLNRMVCARLFYIVLMVLFSQYKNNTKESQQSQVWRVWGIKSSAKRWRMETLKWKIVDDRIEWRWDNS